MFRTGIVAVIVSAWSAFTASPAGAQTSWQFQWRAGQTLSYRVQHTTTVKEVSAGNKVETKSSLTLVKRWQVVDVDPQGLATLHLSLTAMRNEQTRPNGEVLLFDSRDLEKSTPELKEMSKFIGKTLAILRVDRFGRVHEVKEGQASRYESDPPFVLVLPSAAPRQGQAWLRSFNVTIEPPHGAGEKHPAQHRFTCTKLEAGKATIALATEFKQMPDSPQERLPLLQKELQGEIGFDVEAGRMTRAHLTIDKMLENHLGAGSSYHLVSTYTEELAGAQ
jgi:hypothetical protein